jgi:hypothetical protein
MEYKGYTIETEWESDADCTYRIYDGESIIRRGGYFDHEYDAVEQAKLDIDCYPEKYTPDNRPSYPWVKVEDGLPEPYPVKILVVFVQMSTGTKFISKAFFDGDKFYFDDDNEYSAFEYGYRATHWQYLPALPKE